MSINTSARKPSIIPVISVAFERSDSGVESLNEVCYEDCPTFRQSKGMIATSPITPPEMNTGTRPTLSAREDVKILEKYPVDWPTLRRLLATPRLSGVECLATRVVLRIRTAPKLTPEMKRMRIRDK